MNDMENDHKMNMLASTLQAWMPQNKLDDLVQILKPEQKQNQSDNENALKSVEEVIRMGYFFIPDYQRGYRWDEKDVRQFLEDINALKENETNCIQPLVVKEMKMDDICIGFENAKDSDIDKDYIRKRLPIYTDKVEQQGLESREERKIYTVIDGQQRLTTIYIILTYLNSIGADVGALLTDFRIFFQRYKKKREQEFLERVSDKKENEASRKVDFYHMLMAYEEVENFFKGDKNKSVLLNRLLKDTKFIWYTVGENDGTDNEVFSRLNIGKVPLTDTELIRASILNQAPYRQHLTEQEILHIQTEIAREWDEIENALHDPEFWGFICPFPEWNKSNLDLSATRIGLLIQIALECKIENNLDLYKKWSENLSGAPSELYKKIKTQWEKIRNIFYDFCEWYSCFDLYHYVGAYMTLIPSKSDEVYSKLKILHDEWHKCKQREDFIRHIKNKIAENVFNTTDVKNILNKVDLASYAENKYQAKSMLMLHNVQTTMHIKWAVTSNSSEKINTANFLKFPFSSYNQTDLWDIEHIDSRTSFDFKTEESTKKLMDNIQAWLEVLVKDETLGGMSNEKSYDKDWKKFESEFKTRINELDTITWDKGKAMYEDLYNKFQGMTHESESYEDHNIGNLALLDGATNRSYKNAPFPVKRNVILERQREQYIFPCTQNVFTKSYTLSGASLVNWTETDKYRYKQDIKEKIKLFFK